MTGLVYKRLTKDESHHLDNGEDYIHLNYNTSTPLSVGDTAIFLCGFKGTVGGYGYPESKDQICPTCSMKFDSIRGNKDG